MKREPGFYWVTLWGERLIAEWVCETQISVDGRFKLTGSVKDFKESQFSDINETKITE